MRLRPSMMFLAVLPVLLCARPVAADTWGDARTLILAPTTTAALITPYSTQRLLLGLVNTAQARHLAGADNQCVVVLQAALTAVQQVTHAMGQPGPSATKGLHPRARFYGDAASEAAAVALEDVLGKLIVECGG